MLYSLLLGGCVVEEEESFQIKNDPVIKARMWFESQSALGKAPIHSKNSRNNNLSDLIQKKPDWEKTIIHETSTGRVIEVQLNHEQFISVSKNSDKEVKGKSEVLHSLLLFEKDEGYSIYIMRVFPENKNFKFKGDDYQFINYQKVRSDFTGKFRFYNWDESYIGGYVITNGKMTASLVTKKLKADSNKRIESIQLY